MSVIYCDTNVIVDALRDENKRKLLIRLRGEHRLTTSLNLGECFKRLRPDSEGKKVPYMMVGKELEKEKKKVAKVLHIGGISVCDPVCFFFHNAGFDGKKELHLCNSRCYHQFNYKKPCFDACYRLVELLIKSRFYEDRGKWEGREEFIEEMLKLAFPERLKLAFPEALLISMQHLRDPLENQLNAVYDEMVSPVDTSKKAGGIKETTLQRHYCDLMCIPFLGYMDYVTIDSRRKSVVERYQAAVNQKKAPVKTKIILKEDLKCL